VAVGGEPEADVVVIGCGAGGAACAWRLASRGLRVLVLETGPWYDPARDYRLHRDDWERSRFPHKLDPDEGYVIAPLQRLDPGHAHLRSWSRVWGPYEGERRRGWRYHRVLGVGGTTLHFSGEAHRLHPMAFRLHSRTGVGADWPLTYDELEPYYVEVERVVGVAGPRRDPTRPRSAPYPLPAHPLSHAGRTLARGLEQAGFPWLPNPVAILSRPYDGRPPCNYCANCNRGCPRTDKGSADVTFARRALITGRCRIVTGATVLRLVAGRKDRVDGVEYLHGGATRIARARAYVLAAGAVETPRLLLLSAGPSCPEGLANESGLVGRNFMETLAWTSVGLHPEPQGAHRGIASELVSWARNAPDALGEVPGGFRLSPAVPEADMMGPAAYARRAVPGWGLAHRRAMRERFAHALGMGAIGEFLPNEGSRVDLDPERRDRHGRPLARIRSVLDADAVRRLERMATATRAVLEAAGVCEVVEEYGSYDTFSATHVFGTCRMGHDPRTSVVDAWGRSHRWRNLWIADASVFPSSGGGESPSLTVEALALRTADRLVMALGRRE